MTNLEVLDEKIRLAEQERATAGLSPIAEFARLDFVLNELRIKRVAAAQEPAAPPQRWLVKIDVAVGRIYVAGG
jgi:hypothetical protein